LIHFYKRVLASRNVTNNGLAEKEIQFEGENVSKRK